MISSMGKEMRRLVMLIAILLVAGGIVGLFLTPDSMGPTIAKAETQSLAAKTSVQSSCAMGQPGSGSVVAVIGSFEPRTSPSERGARIKNEKASSILRELHYHAIDSSTTVRQVCTDGDWSEVQIVTPEWLTFVKGWVPNNILRGIERTASGTRVYVESDFFWDEDTSKYKLQIVALVNKIAQEHAGCSTVDTASVALSPSKSKPNDPVFFVTCTPSGIPFNVWFRPSDVDKKFTAVSAIPQADAVIACEQAAKARAMHPSTVDFSRFMDVAYMMRQDGRVALDSTFTAKNAFNLELKYRIRCLFDGQTLIEANIAEAQ